ncbi:MAG: response regulator [Thermomicrobiales bacterium]
MATKTWRMGQGTMTRTVLVVDDERFIVDLLAEVLAEEGYAVRRAYDGEAALRDIDHAPPDLVLSDVAMPRVNGLELARRVQDRGIPVILMSAAVSDPRTPGVGFITKPFDLDQILEMVAEHIE